MGEGRKGITSRIDGELVNNITNRSTPILAGRRRHAVFEGPNIIVVGGLPLVARRPASICAMALALIRGIIELERHWPVRGRRCKARSDRPPRYLSFLRQGRHFDRITGHECRLDEFGFGPSSKFAPKIAIGRVVIHFQIVPEQSPLVNQESTSATVAPPCSITASRIVMRRQGGVKLMPCSP